MNCESLPLLMNATLDDELSPEERAEMQQHLKECPACQAHWAQLQGLHDQLTEALVPPSAEPAINRIVGMIQPRSIANPRRPRNPSTRNSSFALVAVVCTLLLAVVTVFQWSTATPAVAEIALSTGTIDFKPANARDWIEMTNQTRVSLPALTRVRTRSQSLCEIRTRSDAIVRLNQDSELVMHRSEKVELVAGELWCRAPVSTGMLICASSSPNQSPGVNVFSCPSSTETQWRALPNQVLTALDAAATPVEIHLPQATCTIQPGESLTFAGGQPRADQARRSNPLQATSWQLPLLALRDPLDSELQDRLTRMLSLVGQSKVSYLYEDQIRKLGPAGAVPLLAYVRSAESRRQPELRSRAMQLAVETAGDSSQSDFEFLISDKNPQIQMLSRQALERLKSEPGNREQ
jgi:ferric-dicitrate binding protein FerR (iron transport regulator)